MNLEHTRMIDPGIGRKNPFELLSDAVNEEARLKTTYDWIIDKMGGDMDAAEYNMWITAGRCVRHSLDHARRWADHHRQAVRELLRAEHAANAADSSDLGAAA